MNIETIREFALSMEGVEESCPFGPNVVVFKVKGKMFLLLPLDTDLPQFNAKCDPEKAIELRETYPHSVLPGYHMNKQHWNTVIVDGQITEAMLKSFIVDSYGLIAGKGKKK